MYTGAAVPLYVNIVTQILLQFMFFTAHTLARSTRTGTLRAIDGLLQARRQVEQREAMFQEVRQDLDRVLQLGGPGRHTDRVLGNYKLGVVIGRGAMGEVYEARGRRTARAPRSSCCTPTSCTTRARSSASCARRWRPARCSRRTRSASWTRRRPRGRCRTWSWST